MTLVAYDLSVGRHVEMPLRHLSPTSLMRAATCLEQFRRQNILGERQAPSEAALVGTAIHDALGMSCVNYIAHQQHLAPVDVATYVEDIGFDSAVEREEEMSGLIAQWNDRDAAKRRASKSSAAWMRDVAPRVVPTGVEGEFDVPMEGLPVPVRGRYDVLTEHSAIDWKSKKQRVSSAGPGWLLQAMIYGFATGLPVEFHVLACTVKDEKVTIVTPMEAPDLLVNLTPGEITGMSRMIRGIYDSIVHCLATYGPDEPWPTTGRLHDWKCDYCSFRPTCSAWEGAV